MLALQHSQVKKEMCEHVRSALVDLAIGLGLPIKGGMAHLAPGLGEEEVSFPRLPGCAERELGRLPLPR